MKAAVVKITGKVFSPEGRERLPGVVSELKQALKEGYRLAIVVGGGPIARQYQELGKRLRLNNAVLDLLGIEVTRLNAALVATAIGWEASLPVPRSFEEIVRWWARGSVVVTGGLQPGQSTNAVAAEIAELVGAEVLVNATNVDGVYDKDPTTNPDARLLKRLTIDDLERILAEAPAVPGRYDLMDPVALKIVKRSRLRVAFVNAFRPGSIIAAIHGDTSVGSWLVWE